MPEVEKAVARGVGAIVIYAGGFAETGDQGSIDQERIIDMCRAGGVELCGPNCMGAMSLHNRSSVFMMDVLDPERLTGNVGVVSQSGSICIGLLYDTRRYGYSHVISTGNEAVTTTAQFIEYLVDDPDTAVIALFSETVREPDRFVGALDRAFDAGKPVVVVRGRQVGPGRGSHPDPHGRSCGRIPGAFGRAEGAPRDRGRQSRGADRGCFGMPGQALACRRQACRGHGLGRPRGTHARSGT